MADDLLTTWLRHYDPIHRGWTPAGIANGVCATSGFAFPRVRGGYNLYRGGTGGGAGAETIVGAAGADAGTVRTFPWVTHGAEASYVYRLRAIGGGGVESDPNGTQAEVAFDADGAWVGPRPNPPSDLRALSVVGGAFEIRWRYADADEQVPPASFGVFSDGGTGTVDWGAPVGDVPYRRGRFHFVWTSSGFAHGERVRWGVRAASAAGVTDGNECFVAAVAEGRTPVSPVVRLRCVADCL